MTAPDYQDECWPVTIPTASTAKWDAASDPEKDAATALAVWTLRTLTLGLVGGCPITVRPCVSAARTPIWRTYPVDGYYRAFYGPRSWVEDCGCDQSCGCSPTRLHSVTLPAPVGPVTDVTIDGATLDPGAYFVDGGNIIRIDGDPWPVRQNLDLPLTEVGTWSVTYLNGIPVDGLGALAAGALALQWLDGLATGNCKLPSRAISVARQGVSMTLKSSIDSSVWPGGRTGVDLADAYIERFNPNHLKTMSAVISPDVLPARRASVQSGGLPLSAPEQFDGGSA